MKLCTRSLAFVSLLLASAGVSMLSGVSGCRAKGVWTEADELRQRVLDLERQLSRTAAERDEARATLAEAQRVRLAGSGDLPAEVLAALPRCAGIELDRLSGLSRDGSSLDVAIKPFDGRQRFVQIVGRLTIRADALPDPVAGGQSAPTLLGTVVLGPAELREAYRSSPMGTHYTIRLLVDPAAIPNTGSIAIVAEFEDALSGQIHTARMLVPAGR